MRSNVSAEIERFLAGDVYAVAGASRVRAKYGNKVLRCYLQNGRRVFAINRHGEEVEGVPGFKRLADIPVSVHGLSIVTPPAITEQLVEEAAELGIRHLWMQPGAESDEALERAEQLGLECIAGGPCLLVVLGYRE